MNAARIGLIVPSSNVTMETEIPALLARQAGERRFTFHSSRMRMRSVTREELAAMNAQGERCVRELTDARCDVLAYACLVAVMATGPRAHEEAQARLTEVAASKGAAAPVVTSAGALISALGVLGAKRVALIAPYMKPLTQRVVDYLEDYGVEIVDSISLEVADNSAVGELDPSRLVSLSEDLKLAGADAVILSAYVQMPSLSSIQTVEDRLRLPVISAATATTYEILRSLDITPNISDAGWLLRASANATVEPG